MTSTVESTESAVCTRCGSPWPSIGRFCTNCGAPRDRAPTPVTVPPPVHQAPPPQRFPLYADESRADQPGLDRPAGASTASIPGTPASAPPAPGGRHRRRSWVPGLTAVAVVLAVLVAVTLFGGDDEPGDVPQDSGSASASASGSDGAADPSTSPPQFEGEPRELAGLATADAPSTDANGVDISTGEPTTYEPANMLDGDPETGWRVTGDATGSTLTFTFDEPVTLTSVGLINGYAKTSVDESGTEFDLYAGSRRVLKVAWVLDGGESIPQTLVDGERTVQLLDVGAIEASTVELRLVAVSAPGEGADARDKTAISEVSLNGYDSER